MSWKRDPQITIGWNSTMIQDAYSIYYHKAENQIIINLPPTEETATDTSRRVVKRKTDLSTSELSFLLGVATEIFKLPEVEKND